VLLNGIFWAAETGGFCSCAAADVTTRSRIIAARATENIESRVVPSFINAFLEVISGDITTQRNLALENAESSLAMLDGIDAFAGLSRRAFTMLDRINAPTRISTN
jgi:hypothetical protein